MTTDATPLQQAIAEAKAEYRDRAIAVTGSLLNEMEWELDRRVQVVFDRHGPARDRGTEWRRCGDEPWHSLAELSIGDVFTAALEDDLA